MCVEILTPITKLQPRAEVLSASWVGTLTPKSNWSDNGLDVTYAQVASVGIIGVSNMQQGNSSDDGSV